MCNIYDEETADIYVSATYRARKERKCDECFRAITAGEVYRMSRMLYDRRWSAFATCAHCNVGHEWLANNCGGVMHAAVADEMQSHADEYPGSRFGLLRMIVGMRRQWRQFSGGGLLRVQPMPRDIEAA